jgi:hypothetical protein
MSKTLSSQTLHLLEVGSKISIAAFEDMPKIPTATVTHIFEDGFGAMCSGVNMFESDDDFYLEMYNDQIDKRVIVKIIG